MRRRPWFSPVAVPDYPKEAFDPERGTGRTTRQMLAAPHGAVYVWSNDSVRQATRLACALKRFDLKIRSVTDLHYGAQRLRGFDAYIVLDHAVPRNESTIAGIERVAEMNSRKKTS